jgi:hypothetical protein
MHAMRGQIIDEADVAVPMVDDHLVDAHQIVSNQGAKASKVG